MPDPCDPSDVTRRDPPVTHGVFVVFQLSRDGHFTNGVIKYVRLDQVTGETRRRFSPRVGFLPVQRRT